MISNQNLVETSVATTQPGPMAQGTLWLSSADTGRCAVDGGRRCDSLGEGMDRLGLAGKRKKGNRVGPAGPASQDLRNWPMAIWNNGNSFLIFKSISNLQTNLNLNQI
jgi:hypothetical protein